jgi:hypothetical protein
VVPDGLWELHDLIIEIRDGWVPDWDQADLVAWIEQQPAVSAFIHDLGRPEARNPMSHGDDTLTALYVIGRLTEILIAPFQPINDDPALLAWTTPKPWWSGPLPARCVWPAVSEAIGATAIAEDAFHPFFHEIVAVNEADDPDEGPSLVTEHWAGALIGSMLLVRSGVTVRAGRNRIDPQVAARSCLYWAWYRRNRVVRDLSHGWGHNSQWRTDFRRDYVTSAELHYNVDAPTTGRNPADEDKDLTRAERIELLRFRHGLLRDLGDDHWPYNDRFIERRS